MDLTIFFFSALFLFSIVVDYLLLKRINEIGQQKPVKELIPTEQIDPDYKKNNITKKDKNVYIEDMKNPYLEGNYEVAKGETAL